jgi:hypothetical protein
MKKFSLVAIGIVFLLAGFYLPVFADSGHGSSVDQAASVKKDAHSALSYYVPDHIKEIYAALAPTDSTLSYNPYAAKYFYPGEEIFFVGRVFFNNPGPYSVYTIVTDAGGKTVLIDPYNYTADSSDRYFFFSTDTLTSGTYNCSILVYCSSGFLLSPTSFAFVVL